jgi:hypothetical protein
MNFGQIIYQIELSLPLNVDSDKESQFIVLCKFNYDPHISEGEEIYIPKWNLGHYDGMHYREKPYSFKVKVVGIKKEIYPPHNSFPDGVFITRYFVEAEDRETYVEIRELIENI